MNEARNFLLSLDGQQIVRSSPTPFAGWFTGILSVEIDDALSPPGASRVRLSFDTSPNDQHDFLFRSEQAAGLTAKVVVVLSNGTPVGQRVVDIRRIGANDDQIPDRYELELDITEETVTGPVSVWFMWPFARV